MLPRLSVSPIYRCRSVFLSKNKGLFIRNFVTADARFEERNRKEKIRKMFITENSIVIAN